MEYLFINIAQQQTAIIVWSSVSDHELWPLQLLRAINPWIADVAY